MVNANVFDSKKLEMVGFRYDKNGRLRRGFNEGIGAGRWAKTNETLLLPFTLSGLDLLPDDVKSAGYKPSELYVLATHIGLHGTPEFGNKLTNTMEIMVEYITDQTNDRNILSDYFNQQRSNENASYSAETPKQYIEQTIKTAEEETKWLFNDVKQRIVEPPTALESALRREYMLKTVGFVKENMAILEGIGSSLEERLYTPKATIATRA